MSGPPTTTVNPLIIARDHAVRFSDAAGAQSTLRSAIAFGAIVAARLAAIAVEQNALDPTDPTATDRFNRLGSEAFALAQTAAANAMVQAVYRVRSGQTAADLSNGVVSG